MISLLQISTILRYVLQVYNRTTPLNYCGDNDEGTSRRLLPRNKYLH